MLPLQAASLILDQAEEDEVDFEPSDDEVDEEERSRQLAESIPLRPVGWVDPVEIVAQNWLAKETAKALNPEHPSAGPSRLRQGPLKLSVYDEDHVPPPNFPSAYPASPIPSTPPSASTDLPPLPPATPLPISQAAVDFLVDTVMSEALPPPSTPSSPSNEAQAWQLLCNYRTGSIEGEKVKTLLDELRLSDEWNAMRIRIMQVEPGDDKEEEEEEIGKVLEAMKPVPKSDVSKTVTQEPMANPMVSGPGSPISEPEEDVSQFEDELGAEDEPEREALQGEQLELAKYVQAVLAQTSELEDYEVFYV